MWLSRNDRTFFGHWWWTIDRWFLACVFALMAMGFMMTMAASPSVAQHLKLHDFYFVGRQCLFLVPTFLVMVGVSFLSRTKIQQGALWVYFFSLAFVFATVYLGVEIKGARRWISMAGFSWQPSEFLKPSLVLIVAVMLSERKKDPTFPGYRASLLFYGLAVTGLMLQPDMGMIILISSVTFFQFFLAGLPLKWLFMGMGGGSLLGLGAYLTFDHVQSRVIRFFNPSKGDPFSDQYQVRQSMEAFINGGLWGRGPGEGTVKTHLPDAHADFIFAVAGEEFGFFMCLGILIVFTLTVVRPLLRVFERDNLFVFLAVCGLMAQFGLQGCINMASTMNVIPTKGMTLPFISYGGSSMVALGFLVGIVLALTRRTTRTMVP